MDGIPEFSVLIVDDDKLNLEVLNCILSPSYTLYLAKSGHAALKIAEDRKPDLILLDVTMPDMNGFEVLTELKRSTVTCNIPVIFITGLSDIEDEEKGFSLGAVDYITKPFHPSIVKARVKTHLEIVRHIRTIERFGMIDALTDIPNRRSFDQQIEIEWGRAAREKTPVSILMIDVDNFKLYNDTYGHQQGDAVLQSLANIFVSTLKRTTDLVFRWGGEEFAVLLPNTGLNGGLAVAEDIRLNVEAKALPDERDCKFRAGTVSIGVASMVPDAGSSITEFIKAADMALYKAKTCGKNRVCSISHPADESKLEMKHPEYF